MNKAYGKYSDNELYLALSGKKKESEAAFAELYSRYSQRIYAYCLRITGSLEDARDIFQDTFYKFYEASQKKAEIENIPAYLLIIARNLLRNMQRENKHSFTFEDINITTNDQGYEQRELLQLIAKALECLDVDHREAFILRQYHGLSHKEISNIIGENISVVKNRIWRAKEKIREILEPYLEDLSK